MQIAILAEQLLASLFGVDEYVVARATNNSAAEGADKVMEYLYGKNALLVYTNPTPALLQPSGGYTFAWSGLLGDKAMTSRVTRFRMEELKSDRVEIEMAFDMKLVGEDLGCFFKDPIA